MMARHRIWWSFGILSLVTLTFNIPGCSDSSPNEPEPTPETSQLRLSDPPAGATITEHTVVSADVSGITDPRQLHFYIDNTLYATDANGDWECCWDCGRFQSGSSHTIHATVEDANGVVYYSDTINVTVSAGSMYTELDWLNPGDLYPAQGEGCWSLLFVTADWCGWCKKFERETLADETVRQTLGESFNVGIIDPDSDQPIDYLGESLSVDELLTLYNVRGVPTVILLTRSGDHLESFPGYKPPDEFVSLLNQIRSGAYGLE